MEIIFARTLRTNQKALEVQQIWDIYTMLTDIEDAFRCMKSELGLRPIYHQKEEQCDGHIFITVIAYHLMHTIRFKLRHKGVKFCWTTIRRKLSTHVRATTTMKRKDNKVIKIRKSSKTEPVHEVISVHPQIGKFAYLWMDTNYQGKGLINLFRTKNGVRRTVSLMPRTKQALLQWQRHQAWTRHRKRIDLIGSALVFCRMDGRPIKGF